LTKSKFLFIEYGSNHWGNSGTTDATRGLPPWLNSKGIHAEGGFYNAFSDSFKRIIVPISVPNREEWDGGFHYNIRDMVFISSTTELGDVNHYITSVIGEVYPFFTNQEKMI
jgi:hypothetical protein